METNIVREYENHMIFISDMKQKLHHLNHQLERSDAFYCHRHSDLLKEQGTIIKILSLALKRLDKIIFPIKLKELETILRQAPSSRNSGDLQ